MMPDLPFIRRRFPIGAHLGRDPLPPMGEMKRDIETMARAGFNLVKLQVNWAPTEPREDILDLARFHELIAHAARFNLGIYVGFVLEHAPHWLYRKHPDCRMAGRNGVPVAYEAVATLPADGKPGPCFDHAGAMADHLDYLSRAAAELGAHANVAIWSTWQEIGHWAEGDWLIGQSVCFCPATLAAFHDFVRNSFGGDLDALKRAWRTNHGDWLDVMPTRTMRGRDGHPVDMAWHDFMNNVVIERILTARARTIRAADPLGRPVFAHKASPAIASGSDRRYAACQDFLGLSAYPAWFPFHAWDDGAPAPGKRVARRDALLAEAWQLALSADHLRSANPSGRTWAAELQGGPVCPALEKGRVPSAADLRRWMLTGVAHGLCGLSFWVLRNEVAAAELNGFALLDSTGDTSERFAEAGRIGAALDRYPALFAEPTLEPAQVAVLVDDANYRFHQALIRGCEHIGHDVRGWHRLLFDLGIPMDFLFAEDFAAKSSSYRAIILPSPLLLTDALAAQLRAWVEAGGILIGEACPGRVDENGFATRGEISAAARGLFGVTQRGYQLIREPVDAGRWTMAERTWGDLHEHCWLEGVGAMAGQRLRPSFCLTTLDPASAQPAFSANGICAGTMNRLGQGQAWLIGSLLGHAGTAYRDPAHHAGIAALLAQAGVAPQMADGCMLRKRITASSEAWFLLNPGENVATVELSTAGFAAVEDLLAGPITRKSEHVQLEVGGLDIRCLILHRSGQSQ